MQHSGDSIFPSKTVSKLFSCAVCTRPYALISPNSARLPSTDFTEVFAEKIFPLFNMTSAVTAAFPVPAAFRTIREDAASAFTISTASELLLQRISLIYPERISLEPDIFHTMFTAVS